MKYKVLQATSLVNEKQLNDLGEEGWILVTIVRVASDCYFFYFAREQVQVSH